MSYAIFRLQQIPKLKDLGQIGSHNLRLKGAYKSNPDINKSLSKNNISLISCDDYTKDFYKIVKPYKQEHEEKMKTIRENRKKPFSQKLDDSNSVVADELLFTSDNEFFKNMDKEAIMKWGNASLDFVYKDLAYTKEQVLNAEIHFDEKTPHLHCVVVPLVKKYDNRTKSERYTISKKQYIKDSEHLSELQDKYQQRMVDNGFDLERGIKYSDSIHTTIKEYKKLTKKIDQQLTRDNEKLIETINELEKDVNNSKETIIGNYIKVDKNTYSNMKTVVSEAKKVVEQAPKMKLLVDELNDYSTTYKKLQKDNRNKELEINRLNKKNNELKDKYSNLLDFVHNIVYFLKDIFKTILTIGREKQKDNVVTYIKELYDQDLYSQDNIIDIVEDTSKEKELFNYIGYMKESHYTKNYDSNYSYDDLECQNDDDFDMEI